MEEIKVLQVGADDWSRIYALPDRIEFTYTARFEKEEGALSYDIVFVDGKITDNEAQDLYEVTKAYTFYVTDRVKLEGRLEWLYRSRKGKRLQADQIQQFLRNEIKYFYPGSYGEKFRHQDVSVSRNYMGSIQWNGNHELILTGKFGAEYTQAVFWRRNIPVKKEQTLDLWLEYQKSPEVSIELTVTQFAFGSVAEVKNRWKFCEMDLEQVIQINGEEGGNLFFSLRAKGNGTLKVIALHDRYSRGTHGYFIPGGERYVTSGREELFAYFEPGDMKPPLNVYFSGYKTKEGFEGYSMMKALGAPFLLIAEQRLEGGCFYIGSDEYEQMTVNVIRKYMDELRFWEDDVILSGISMGTYGAMYYGCEIRPHAVIVGKPLVNIGEVAANEKRNRPGGFPTSLDMLRYLGGDMDEKAQQKSNSRFWDKFDRADWERTKFVVSYMIEDDYDSHAYQDMLSHLSSEGAQIYGKGLHGRHNDNTQGIVTWFRGQFERILLEDFGRGK